jgi:hypothetical protein
MSQTAAGIQQPKSNEGTRDNRGAKANGAPFIFANITRYWCEQQRSVKDRGNGGNAQWFDPLRRPNHNRTRRRHESSGEQRMERNAQAVVHGLARSQQRLPKMICDYGHAFPKVETMGVLALNTGVKV